MTTDPLDEPGSLTGPRVRYSTQVSEGLQARVRAAVHGVSLATGTDYSLVQLTEEALDRHVRQLEETYNGGRPFPTIDAPLRRGRRSI